MKSNLGAILILGSCFLCYPRPGWTQEREEAGLLEISDLEASDSLRIIKNGDELILKNNVYKYSDYTLYKLVSPVPKSKMVMETKIATKVVSITDMAIGAGIVLYFTGEGMVVDGAGWKPENSGKMP
jgi:hypothetical protein